MTRRMVAATRTARSTARFSARAPAGVQAAIFVISNSVALLPDLIHNAGDALTAVPLGNAENDLEHINDHDHEHGHVHSH